MNFHGVGMDFFWNYTFRVIHRMCYCRVVYTFVCFIVFCLKVLRGHMQSVIYVFHRTYVKCQIVDNFVFMLLCL